ncbi:apolipoprotein C-I [Hipposideros larvatus]|uniref:Apolipoprotein C-I n=1 Tax=Hipposideros armiger TaxID=186990 RepID=A0A8B7Q1M9_HIPAR|nr:PREDICTED: apolipoprotein C-I [Hipposideros armiger]
MRLMLSLPVLVVVLAMVLEDPVDALSDIDFSRDLKKFGSALEEKVRTAIDHIKQSDIPRKTRVWFSETYSKVKEKFKTTFF